MLEHVQQGLNEADEVHRDGDGVGQREHQADGATELRTLKLNEEECVIVQGTSRNAHLKASNVSGHDGGLMVSVLTFYSDDPSSNPADYLK